MRAVKNHAPDHGIALVCMALSVSRAGYYRSLKPKGERITKPRPAPSRALNAEERSEVLNVLHSPRFVDKAPGEIVATLLDVGLYHCSVRTMYRILESEEEVRERRNQLRHPEYKKPELLASAPNQVWSWDITKLKGPVKWTYYYLYVILDIFSRYVVGWLVASRENSDLAVRLISETCRRQGIDKNQLTLHADRGSPMKAKYTAQLLADLGVTKSHSRPHVSNDNPYSEAQFKTLKYRPDFPQNFGSQQDARGFCSSFFHWYNNEHKHSGLNMMTPYDVHCGLADAMLAKRRDVMREAFKRHPERFVKGEPSLKKMPTAVWINPPKTCEEKTPSTTASVMKKDESRNSMSNSGNIP
jgi:putative transposase